MGKQLFAGADRHIFERAKALRKQQTAAEEILWMYLRQKPLGYKFRRQHPFGIYILDFYCYQLKLRIEIDGSVHNNLEVKQNDVQREQTLYQLGIHLMRFINQEVMTEARIIEQTIEAKLIDLRHDRAK